ncbi:unnamed protein product [Rhodiola kirilowii]
MRICVSMKVEQASLPQTSKSSTGVTPKVSMFGVKFGFVIPKNKLSGSLVPAFRGVSKSGNTDPVRDENKEQDARKTRWGPDPTQDAFVRKARLLAYQTRVNQITQLIETKDLETEVGQDADMEPLNRNQESSQHGIDAEELEELKLERREIIGEILKLNPNYKAPPDYIPLLKEDRVPLPMKDYPGYNFLGLIYGSGSDTLKRLEKETGAKIQVFGTRRDSAEKVEITSDDKKSQDDYMELYVLVSADTYDKVDSAVALVELLVTPVTVSSASGPTLSVSSTPIVGQSSEAPSEVPNAAGAGVVQPLVRPTHIFQDQFQYNSPAPVPSNPSQLISSQMNSGGMVPAGSNGPLISHPSPFPSVPQPLVQFPMQQPYVSDSHIFGQANPPRNPPMAAPQSFPSQSNLPNAHQFSGSQPTPMGMSSLVRPLGHSWPQSAPDNLTRSQLNQDGSSIRWPRPPVPTPNISIVGITGVPAQGQQNTAFGMAPSFDSRPSAFLLPSNMNQSAATNTFAAPPQVRSYSALPQGSSAATTPIHPMPNLAMQNPLMRGPVDLASQNPAYRLGAVPLPGPSASMPPLHQSNFLPARSVTDTVPRMQFPNSGDFAFQSQHLQNAAAQMNPWPGSTSHNNPPLRPTMQRPLDIRAPPFQPDFPIHPQRPFLRGEFRPHADHHFDRFQSLFTERSDVFSRPTFRPFQYESFEMRNAPLSRMGEMNFNRYHQRGNLHGSFPSRNDYLSPGGPDRNPSNRNPFARPTFRPSSGSQQAYDPFSPTTASTAHHQPQVSTDGKAKIQENNNPENDDLVASAVAK